MTAMHRKITLDGSRFWDIDGRLIPVLAGADPEALYPEVPADLTGVSDADLQALSQQITERAAVVTNTDADGRADLIGDLSIDDVLAATETALDGRDRIATELAAREQAEAERTERLEALAARATPEADAGPEDEPEGDGDDEPAEDDEKTTTVTVETPAGDAAEEREPALVASAIDEDALAAKVADKLAAALRPAKRKVPAPGRNAPARSTGPSGPTQTLTLLASGEEVTSRAELGQAFGDRMQNMGRSQVDGEKIPLARIRTEYPEDRTLKGQPEHDEGVLRRIFSAEHLRGPQALVAAGGICAPPMPSYDVTTFATADRPVRDSLPSLGAPRGAISYLRPLGLAAITGGYGIITAAEDADFGSGGDPEAVKECMRIECDDVVTATIEARYHCLTIGNFDARTWPERIAAYVELMEAAWARMTEAADVTYIKTNSTAVTQVAGVSAGGGLISLLAAIYKARAGMISRHRMPRDQRFRVVLPEYLLDALPVDQLRGGQELVRGAVEANLARHGVSVTWYKDGVTAGTAQVYGAQNTGAITDFPTSVQWGFFPEGSFAALDAGVLDLGLVRDSTLNSTNDYQLFAESFEGMAYQGIESYWVTQTLCYSGQVQEAGKIMECASDASGPELILPTS